MPLATRGQLNPRPCSLLYGEGPVRNSAGILQSWDSCCTLEIVQEADRKRGHPGVPFWAELAGVPTPSHTGQVRFLVISS